MFIKNEINTDIELFDKILKDAIKINIEKKRNKNKEVQLMRDKGPMKGPGFHTSSISYTPQDAGKSRRRHRRGRTLHKRRKSRKVRKTRCRRGRM
jgi:hypothetical protein